MHKISAQHLSVVRSLIDVGRAQIASETTWTRETFARNADGFPVFYKDPTAVAFCGRGAIFRASILPSVEHLVIERECRIQDAIRCLETLTEGFTLHRLNDQLGHEKVLQVFDDWLSAHPKC